MFTDTHCHLSYISERGENLPAVIAELERRGFPFVLDIGTKPGDFTRRRDLIGEAANGAVSDGIHFSCGLWPDTDVIADRLACLAALEEDLRAMLDFARVRAANRAGADSVVYAALGECGLDRFWNGPAAAERIAAAESAGTQAAGAAASDDGPGTTDVAGEEELFGMQLDLAKKYELPVIVHSRDAFAATLGCIRNASYDSGVIHCFSYGIDEARAFLDRGWYISFPGNITWPKKEADRERVASLVRYVPRDRLLLETDAPYLSPAPYRGTTNTPILIEHTYIRAAEILGMPAASLAALVESNARALFAIG
jgi:TatD DNase family protein